MNGKYAACLLVMTLNAFVFADGGLHRYKGMRQLDYDYRTGEITWSDDAPDRTREFATEWAAIYTSGFFWGSGTEIALDWGDMPAGARPISRLGFAYATNSTTADGITCDVAYYLNDDGRDSRGRILQTQVRLRGLPGVDPDANVPNNTGQGFVIRAHGFTPFDLAGGPDLDAPNGFPTNPFAACLDVFGYSDFSYTFRFRATGGRAVGPVLVAPAADPNLPPCPGMGAENAFDWYTLDPNHPPADPNAIMQPDTDFVYAGTFWFDSPFSQFWLRLESGSDPNTSCPGGSSCDLSDIDNDCQVALSDLALLLADFGNAACDPGTCAGDLDGDDDVDLSDLAILLAAFGLDCT